MSISKWISFVVGITSVVIWSMPARSATLNVYSSRSEELIKPVFDLYTKETGVKIEYLTDKEAPLIKRLSVEGAKTPADILITVDAGNLWLAETEGLLASVESETLTKNIPEHLRSPKNNWFGYSVRARTIVYNPARVKTQDLSTYENLSDPKWKGRLCLRTSQKVYNQSLVAMFIAKLGEKKTEEVVSGWVTNLATPVFPNDTKVIEAVVAGQCDVGIVNSYYFGRMQEKDPKIAAALFWPNQKEDGVHVNISGAGMVKHSKHKKEARKFLEWLSTPQAQKLFAELNHEFPANPKVEASDIVQGWGPLKQNVINVSKAGELQVQSIKLMDRVNYK